MSKPKILDLSIDQLEKIAQAINDNTTANRTRNREDKISTDIFIKQFGINRKDFSETIKHTGIKYDRSTFLYNKQLNFFNTEVHKRDTKVAPIELIKNNNNETLVTPTKYKDSETIVIKGETVGTNVGIVEFENMKSELVEMLEWYKSQRKKENIIDIDIPIISIDKDKLNEIAATRGFKIYPKVIAEFKDFCKQNSQYNMQDLMAMALIEYIDKYNKK